jgi:ketose-bisphosphate aldolase
MKEMLEDARRGGYAVCYCESWSLESLQAVVEAAEAENSPIIAGFNGGFLLRSGQTTAEKLSYYAALHAPLESAQVPVAFLLNETDSLAQIEQGIVWGFNAVMVENENLSKAQYLDLVKLVVKLAHMLDMSVEAQVGHLPDASVDVGGAAATARLGPNPPIRTADRGEPPTAAPAALPEPTDPEAARAFVKATNIDALAVAVGNVHILTSGKSAIDFDALARIRDAVEIPLVLHGGTGIPLEMAPRCIELGVAKVNFGTGLKQAYLAAITDKLAKYHEPMSPHPFLGMGGENDLLVAGREAVKAEVVKLLRAFGSAGKARRQNFVK